MRFELRASCTALLFTLVIAGCQEPQGPPAKPPATPPDVPREIQQPQGQQPPQALPNQQQDKCDGLCGALLGPGAWTVSYCTANANGCPAQTANNLLCSTTPAFAQECQRRNACPPGTKCTPILVAMQGPMNANFVHTPNAPGCKAPTPHGCVVTFTFQAKAGALCGCTCL